MLTTTIDGLWVLQVLTGIEVLAPELGLRPHFPSVESRRMALSHPVAAELRTEGVIADNGDVDAVVVDWLTVLSRREVALVLHTRTPSTAANPERVLLARFAQWWVALERDGITIRISGAGAAGDECSAVTLIGAQIERLCGRMTSASLRPVTLAVDDLVNQVRDAEGLRAFLADRKLDPGQVAALSKAADIEQSAQMSIVAVQSGVEQAPARVHIESGAVTIIDTTAGRLLSECVVQAGKAWLITGPGSTASIVAAVRSMLQRLPAQQDWHSFRKAV